MNKKRLLIALAITTALAVPFTAFAATSDSTAAKSLRGLFGIDASKLTDTQKSDVKDYAQKAADLQKDFINKMVANGSMTREQADVEIKKIEDNLASNIENGFTSGFGFQKGDKIGKGGFDNRDNIGMGAIDTSKLTDQQKSELTNIYMNIANLQKENVNKMVTSGLITKEQGDAYNKKIEEIINGTQKVGISDSLKMFNGFGGFSFFNIKGFDSSKLTEQQQADMKDTADKMMILQKEVITKLVSFEVLTQEQGDAIIKRFEATSNLQGIKNIPGIGKGRIEERDAIGKPKAGDNTIPNRTRSNSTGPNGTKNEATTNTKS